jgi:hypothetical protein
MNPIAIGVIAAILAAAALIPYVRPTRGRHSNTLGPAHTGHETGAGPEAEYGWPLNTPAARAAIVDLAAALRQAAIDAVLRRELDHANTLNQHAARLEAVLRRWDTTAGAE